jgi:hypothetical protein
MAITSPPERQPRGVHVVVRPAYTSASSVREIWWIGDSGFTMTAIASHATGNAWSPSRWTAAFTSGSVSSRNRTDIDTSPFTNCSIPSADPFATTRIESESG